MNQPFATLAVVAAVAVGCGSTSGRSTLDRAASTAPPVRFSFADRPDSAGLLECLGAAEILVVTVDAEGQAMAVRRDSESSPVVVWTAESSFVDASLLTSGSGWIRIDRAVADPIRTEIGSAVGPSLSGYVFADRIVPDPVALARSALDAATDVVETENADGTVTVSVTTDESVGDDDTTDVGNLLELQFTLDGHRITAIAARPSAEEESLGFVWEYQYPIDEVDVSAPSKAIEVVDIAQVIGTGVNSQPDCALGS